MEHSFFMQDSSLGNQGTEALLNFQMSWLMRLSEEGKCNNSKLAMISRKAVFKLLRMAENDNIRIKKVEVWKEWRHIDVLAEVTIQEEGIGKNEVKHIVAIENKVYTRLKENQLNKNSSAVLDYYHNTNKNLIHFWLINANEETFDEFEEHCRYADEDWKQLWFYDVIGGKIDQPIGNDLFDEFWVKMWY